jgi:hypothetical protein
MGTPDEEFSELRGGDQDPLIYERGSDGDSGPGPGLSAAERAAIDARERELDLDRARRDLGRYRDESGTTRSIRERDAGAPGPDAFADAAARLGAGSERTPIEERENDLATAAVIEAFKLKADQAIDDPFVANFSAVVDGFTTRKSSLTMTLTVEWEDRAEVYRVFDETPMSVSVRIEKHHG